MKPRHALLLVFGGALGCVASDAPAAETVTRVNISGVAGRMGVTELHHEPGRTVHILPVPSDSVWRALPRVYELLGIPEPGALPEQRLFGARNFRTRRIEGKRLSAYVDCGMGPTATPKADEYEVVMSLLTRLEPMPDATTRVETVMAASGRAMQTAGNPISCQSNGVLEGRVSALVAWVLLSGR